MHEEVITTTSATSKFGHTTIVNSTSLHQSHHDDGSTITVSIVHPHQHQTEIGDFIAATNINVPSSVLTNQINPSQTKIIVNSNSELQSLKDDVSVIINGTISNSNDPNVLMQATETCDSDKHSLSLSNLTSSHIEQVEIDLHDVYSPNDETSSREEGEFPIFLNHIRLKLWYR